MVGCFRGNEAPEGSDPEFEELVASGRIEEAARRLDQVIFSGEEYDDGSVSDQISDACSEEHFSQDFYGAMLLVFPGTPRSTVLSYTFEILLISVCAINSQLADDPSITQELAEECGSPVRQEASCAGIAGAWIASGGEGDMYQTCTALDDLISSDMEGWLEDAVRDAIQEFIAPEVTV